MEYIKEWLNNVAMYLIFMIFLNMLIANKSYKKYISLVVGFVFILILLDPICKIFKSDFDNFNKEIVKYEQQFEEPNAVDKSLITEENKKKMILEIYRENIKTQVENLLKKNIPEFRIVQFDIDIGSEDSNTGELKKLKLELKKKPEYRENDITNKNIEEKVKLLLKNFYNISEDNIYINVQV